MITTSFFKKLLIIICHVSILTIREFREKLQQLAVIAIEATGYIINKKNPPDLTNQFYNERTIQSHLIDRLTVMKFVEPLDLTISSKTLDKGIIDAYNAVDWDTSRANRDFNQANPYLVIKLGNILATSIMLVFQK